jgi:hypothetical protein
MASLTTCGGIGASRIWPCWRSPLQVKPRRKLHEQNCSVPLNQRSQKTGPRSSAPYKRLMHPWPGYPCKCQGARNRRLSSVQYLCAIDEDSIGSSRVERPSTRRRLRSGARRPRTAGHSSMDAFRFVEWWCKQFFGPSRHQPRPEQNVLSWRVPRSLLPKPTLLTRAPAHPARRTADDRSARGLLGWL